MSCFLKILLSGVRNWDGSVSIVTDYKLDDWDSIPNRGKLFFF
jgi:hypothetical protein